MERQKGDGREGDGNERKIYYERDRGREMGRETGRETALFVR